MKSRFHVTAGGNDGTTRATHTGQDTTSSTSTSDAGTAPPASSGLLGVIPFELEIEGWRRSG